MYLPSDTHIGIVYNSTGKKIKIRCMDDGLTHYNLGTTGRSSYALELSIYQHYKFTHEELGAFSSLSGFIAYMRSGKKAEGTRLHYGIRHTGYNNDLQDSSEEIGRQAYLAIKALYSDRPELLALLQSTYPLPLTNYHVFGNSVKSRPEYRELMVALGKFREDSMEQIKGDTNVNHTHVTTGELR